MGQARHSRRQSVKVYISHSEVDMVFARKMRNLLVDRLNAQVFTTEDLSAGEKWEPKLRSDLSSTDLVIALLTPHSVDSKWVLHEIGAAWALKKPIIPVVTRRDVLHRLPVSVVGAQVIELPEIENRENADKFVDAFEESLAAAHVP
ncbi:MAG: toll/interleukin-1 receptor domain-containing protein [Bryobacterales bacterium]|nr:toll/interleukin-1 receptor domain-containing protein [Bryobacterales bacterium]